MTSKEQTHFGFTDIDEDKKTARVGQVFSSVSNRYDLMNDLMSFGTHRIWKKFTAFKSGLRTGQSVLDVAAGTGDMSLRFSSIVGESGRVVMTDINQKMLQIGYERLIDAGLGSNIDLLIANAEDLPLAEKQFDCVCIAFGLRNVTRIPKALTSMRSMLRPGGRLIILEFSHPKSSLLSTAYDAFSFKLIPSLGEIVTGDRASYKYLVESIRRHPDQDSLSKLMQESGLEDVTYYNLSGGIVALHVGFRY